MKKAEKIFLGVGIMAFVFVAWKMPWASIAWAVRGVGFGFLFIFAQELAAHILNTLGWSAAFLPEHRRMVPSFWRLLRLRIAGDAVGYLIPSALVAGELAKAAMIGDSHPIASRLSSIVVSKFTQMLAFALISIGSLFLIAQGKVSFGNMENPIRIEILLLVAFLLLILGLKFRRVGWRAREDAGSEGFTKPYGFTKHQVGIGISRGWRDTIKMLDKETKTFLKKYPVLFLLSIISFSLAYLWGAFEAYWIARFIGLPISAGTALTIEILSISVDGILFMVPAKAGSQELSKTAIFAALNLPKTAGFTFGLIRHTREILWALLGLALFYRVRGNNSEALESATSELSQTI